MRLRSGIQTAEIWKDEHDTNLMHMGIAIEYDTQTGEIGFDLQETEPVGAHTRLRTSFDYKSTMYQVQGSWVTDYQSASIRLLRQSGAPTVEQLNAYVMHEEVPEPEFRVVPERVIPEYPQLVGLHDRWGEDTYGLGIDPSGDDIVLDTLRRFNALHGPRG
ncbi:MAG TPA: hypothetical protein VFT53_01720 [Candidatus Saccharimonadales bacterium]|nr:hypothetical protein [Candidatus Saccharimonadales bacterium]